MPGYTIYYWDQLNNLLDYEIQEDNIRKLFSIIKIKITRIYNKE